MTLTLAPYQKQGVDSIISYLQKNPDRNPILSAATGTGKSILIASLIHRITTARPDARIMVGCHVAKLLKQNASKLRELRPDADISFYSDSIGEKRLGGQFVFAGIQSVFRMQDAGRFNMLIIDEVQSVGRDDMSMWGRFIKTLRKENPRIIIVGFSATPWREDSGSLTEGKDAIFDEIVFDYSLAKAVQDGYLCRLVGKSTETKYDISGVKKLAGEFNQKQLEEATNVDHLTRSAVTETIKRAHNRRAWLAFCNGVKHSYAVRDEMIRQGIPCATVTGDTPDDERDRILAQLESGELRCVTNNGVWTTGVDAPFVDCIIMLRHTMSTSLLLQMGGRGTRLMANVWGYETAAERRKAISESSKPDCLFLDFAGNIERHGFLDEIKPKKKKEKGDGDHVAPMKSCPECFSLVHAPAKKCPDCGHEFPVIQNDKIGNLYSGAVMSGESETREVIDVVYTPHNLNKEGKIPCLRVQYHHNSGYPTNEYICLQHEGFAFTKAEKWWKERDGSYMGAIENRIENLIKYKVCEKLLIPRKILVTKDGKYERIKSYQDFVTPDKFYKQDQSLDNLASEEWYDEFI